MFIGVQTLYGNVILQNDVIGFICSFLLCLTYLLTNSRHPNIMLVTAF